MGIHTRKSQYDNNCIVLIDDKEDSYLMNVNEILKIKDLESTRFRVVKKRVLEYLEVIV